VERQIVPRLGKKIGIGIIGDMVIGVLDTTLGITRQDRTDINKAIVMAATTINTVVLDILQYIVLRMARVMLTDKPSIIKTITNQLKIKVNNSTAVAVLILKVIPT
jgi:hypothetical protein